jgi:putative transcriptional regulator
MDFFKYKNQFAPEKGRLLISEPFLPDPNFERSVVLLCENNDEGSFGFVLNKPSLLSLGEVIEMNHLKETVFVGGPVQQDTLHFIHRNSTLIDAREIHEGVYWGGKFEALITLIDTNQMQACDVRFFLGYSGWEPGQLDEELEANSWIVCDYVDDHFLFAENTSEMWKKALENMGGRFSVYSNYPIDPRLN